MKKEELWQAICAKYPEFNDDEHILKQKARGLRRLVEQAWDEGHAHGLKNGMALESMKRDAAAKKNPFEGLF